MMAPSPRHRLFATALIAVALGLSSCASAPPQTFDLNAASAASGVNLRATLAIREPVASADIDSQRILVRTGRDTLANLAGAQWSDRLPALVQARLVQSFQNARQLRFVGRAGAGFVADYDMELDIRAFELDVAAARADVDIAVKIVSAQSGRVVAAQIFVAQAPASGTGGAEAAAALNAALDNVMRQIMRFASAHI
jgi:cholesterol transport system auxiliary component